MTEFQAKPKQEERDTSGPRLNDKIKVEFVRLVTEEGLSLSLSLSGCVHTILGFGG